jgi:hypothetical protein
MKRIIPAVFFQKHLNGVQDAPKTPARLELFESELRTVVGGLRVSDGSGGTVTYAYSGGVAYPSDCAD